MKMEKLATFLTLHTIAFQVAQYLSGALPVITVDVATSCVCSAGRSLTTAEL